MEALLQAMEAIANNGITESACPHNKRVKIKTAQGCLINCPVLESLPTDGYGDGCPRIYRYGRGCPFVKRG